MADPTDLVGYTPDLQTAGVWFGPLNAVARRLWFPCELSLVWVFLPDPRARPIPLVRRGPTGALQFFLSTSGAGQWFFPTLPHRRETSVSGGYTYISLVDRPWTNVDLASTIESSSPRG